MKTYQPLNCDLHDFLEIACMRNYLLDVELIDGSRLTLRASTTRTAETKEEFLVFENGSVPAEIRMDQLAAITPVEPGAGFGRIELNALTCAS